MRNPNDYRSKLITSLVFGVLLLLLGWMVLRQGNPATRLPRRDSGAFIYIGSQILDGKLPYRDAWDSKPPAIFYTNAMGLILGRGTRWGIWAIEWISFLAAGIFSYISVKKLWGTLPAIGSLLLWSTGLNLALEGGNFTEEYPLPLHFLSVMLFLGLVERPKHRLFTFSLGLAFGISFLFRPNNAVVEATIIFILFLLQIMRREGHALLSQALWTGLGALLPVLLTAVYFWNKGILFDVVEASFFYNVTYSTTALTTTSPLVAGFRIFGLLAWIAMAGYLVAMHYALKSKEPIYYLLLIGWPLSIYVSDLAKRNYPHYYINWLPFLGLLGGLFFYFVLSHLPSYPKRQALWERVALGVTAVSVLVAFFLGGSFTEYKSTMERIAKRDTIGVEVLTRSAAYVKNHTEPNDFVLFWAASPGENFMAHRATPSASLFYPLYLPSEVAKQLSDQFLQDIRSKRPVLIVDMRDNEALSLNPEERAQQIAGGFAWEYPPDNLNDFFEFVEENYSVVAKLGKRTIYRLHER